MYSNVTNERAGRDLIADRVPIQSGKILTERKARFEFFHQSGGVLTQNFQFFSHEMKRRGTHRALRRIRMTSTIKNIILVGTVAAMLLASSTADGQQPESKRTNRPIPQKQVRKDGWRIPGADHFTTLDASKRILTDGVEIERKSMKSSVEDPLVDSNGNPIGPSTPSTPTFRLFAVREFYSFQVKERTFAYWVRLVIVEVEANNRRVYAGGMYNLYYYDEDGDGTFETRYSALRSVKVPKWARELAQQ